LIRKYIYGPGIDEPACMVASGGIWYYHFDGLGSVAALTDSGGTLVEKYRYDAFGGTTILAPNNQTRTTSLYGNRFMFTGREWDSTTQLYYYRARDYSPTLGRFLQPDPIGYYDSMNLYAYCLNNRVNEIDPFGLWAICFGGGINVRIGYGGFTFGGGFQKLSRLSLKFMPSGTVS